MHTEIHGSTTFTYRLVDNPEMLKEIFKLRYQVYCNECHFLNAKDYPNDMESDKYDQYSLHFVAADEQGPIGTVRMIRNSQFGFPLMEHCRSSLALDIKSLRLDNCAEISRLVISKQYRKRSDDGKYYSPDFDPQKTEVNEEFQRRIRPMAFGMYREMYQESKRRGITHWFALMENSLWILLKLHNIIFFPIGSQIDFYGPVKPYMVAVNDIENTLMSRMPRFFDLYFLDGLEQKYRPKSL